MSVKDRKPLSKQQAIIEVWEQMGKLSAGATELDLIEQALVARLGNGASESPASVARTLADHGVPLQHPEILIADVRWRQKQMSALFSPEELNLVTLRAASEWVEKLDALYRKLESDSELATHRLRQLVLQIKSELEIRAVSKKAPERERQLAQEVAQWLTIWLQNPQIFLEWFDLRRNTMEFQERSKL